MKTHKILIGAGLLELCGWLACLNAADSSRPAGARTWTLRTADTQIVLNIIGNRPAIVEMQDAVSGWNWTPQPVALPLLQRVSIGAKSYDPHWVYSAGTVEKSQGTQVTLTFTSTGPCPALTLTQTWWAAPTGGGPIEVTTSVTNDSSSAVTYQDADIIPTDVTLTADQAVTLWRFSRSSYADLGKDTGFTTGVFTQTLGPSARVASTMSNSYVPGPYMLPLEMLDVGGTHGAYIGYEMDFGHFTTSTAEDPKAVRTVFQLWDAKSFSQAAGTTLPLPGMFYGTYAGDTDRGSNQMKAWFWAHRMTPTLRNTPGEPLIEADCSIDSEANFLHKEPGIAAIESWGVELLKQDDTWTDDDKTDMPFGWDWRPNPAYWPKGVNLRTLTHEHHMKLSLYLANRYNHADLSTAAGEAAEQTAIETRFEGTAPNYVGRGFDYWRTDMEWEPTTDYLSHLGFLRIMDHMIAAHPDFRWENCSGGGSKKSFDIAQRESFGVVEDSGLHADSITHFIQSYYASSYVFNPAQLGEQNADFMTGTEAQGLYNFRAGFLGAWLWGLQAATWPGNTHYPDYVALYKAKQRAILRGADVHHILPMPTGKNWFGIELFNRALNRGSVILLKPNSGVKRSPTIVLKGLVPTTTYQLTFQDRTSLNGAYTGKALMTTGISPLSGHPSDVDSEIIWINY